MGNYPKIIGYLGACPFIVLTILLFLFNADPVLAKLYAVFLLCYASLICCFLSGTHWSPALRDQDNVRLTLSVAPTIICSLLLFYGFAYDPFAPLLGAALLFGGQYYIDKKYYDMSVFPEWYLSFRFSLTFLVSGLLVVGFCLSL